MSNLLCFNKRPTSGPDVEISEPHVVSRGVVTISGWKTCDRRNVAAQIPVHPIGLLGEDAASCRGLPCLVDTHLGFYPDVRRLYGTKR